MKRKPIPIVVISLLAVSVACTLPFGRIYTDEDVAAIVQQTVQAYQTQNAPVLVPTDIPATPTALPTSTPLPLPTATQANKPTATPQACNQAVFISETIKDDTKFEGSQTFTKSWRLKNTGTCTWNPNYTLIFSGGDQMSGPNSVKLDEYVKPGEQVDVLIDLKAPAKTGTYTGYWKMRSDDGEKFMQVYVRIKVNSPFFAVNRVVLTSEPAVYDGACPVTLTIKADITTTSAGRVTYKWERSDGVTSETKAVKFTAKGTKTVQFDWEVGTTDTHWVRIYIDAPNHQWFGPLDVDVTCQ